jgi:hypothetical protein
MTLLKFLTIISYTIGLLSSLYLIKGVLSISTKTIALKSISYLGANIHSLKDQCSQKADYMVGFMILIFSFLIQIIISLFDIQLLTIYVDQYQNILIFLIIIQLLISYAIDNCLSKLLFNKSKLLLAIFKVESKFKDFKNNSYSNNHFISLIEDSKLLTKYKYNDENYKTFLYNYCKYLKIEVPDYVDHNLINNCDESIK